MKRKLIIIFFIFIVVSSHAINNQFPPSSYLRFETGLFFSKFGDMNKGIDGYQDNVMSGNVDFKALNFQIPFMLKYGIRPFWGKVGRNLSINFRSGYSMARSDNKFVFTDETLTFDFSLNIIPVEIGLEYSFLNTKIFGKTFELSAGLGFGFYYASYVFNYDAKNNISGENLDKYPYKYSGIGFGGSLSLSAQLLFTKRVALFFSVQLALASIKKLQGDIQQDDGSVRRETLYVNDAGFVSSDTKPDNASRASMNLSGLGICFGIQLSFGEKRKTNIPKGLYR